MANGEEIAITRHEKPVARIVPEGRRSLRELSESVDAIQVVDGGCPAVAKTIVLRWCPAIIRTGLS